MKWLLIVAGSLVGIVALVTGIGWLMPQGHVASATARFDRPSEVVWAAITEYEKHPQWRKELRSVELVSPGDKPIWKEMTHEGESIALQTLEVEPMRRLVRKIADPELPFGGTWTYEIEGAGQSTLLRITERGEVYNPVFRFINRIFMSPTASLEVFLKQMGTHFGQPNLSVEVTK